MATIYKTAVKHRLCEGAKRQFTFAATLLLMTILGCEVPTVVRSVFSSVSFHDKFNLRPVDYFDDPQVVKLCEAIEDNDLDEMKRLIAAGVDVNTIGKGGVTPLFWAFPDNQLDRFVLLLDSGADPNVRLTSNLNLPNVFRAGDTVMHLAARSHFPTQFLEVMKHGGDPTVPGRRGDSVLHEIIRAGVPNAHERISAAVASGADINAIDRLEATPIETAVGRFGQYDLAIQLIELGANPTVTSHTQLGNTIHSVLASKRSVDQGHGLKIPEEYEDMERFIATLRDRGYDVDEALEDLKRWAKLSKQRPRSPGWFREDEISFLQKRTAERERQKK